MSTVLFLLKLCHQIHCKLVVVVAAQWCDPGTVAHQVLLSTEFSRQEYWSG